MCLSVAGTAGSGGDGLGLGRGDATLGGGADPEGSQCERPGPACCPPAPPTLSHRPVFSRGSTHRVYGRGHWIYGRSLIHSGSSPVLCWLPETGVEQCHKVTTNSGQTGSHHRGESQIEAVKPVTRPTGDGVSPPPATGADCD